MIIHIVDSPQIKLADDCLLRLHSTNDHIVIWLGDLAVNVPAK